MIRVLDFHCVRIKCEKVHMFSVIEGDNMHLEGISHSMFPIKAERTFLASFFFLVFSSKI